MNTQTILLLIESYDILIESRDDELNLAHTELAKKIQDHLETLMEDTAFVSHLENEFAMDEGSTILDDDLPDATQEYLSNMDFSERLTRYHDFLTQK